MSHHTARPSALLKKRTSVRARRIFIPAILIALLVIAINAKQPLFFGVDREDWPFIRGQVMSTRISVVGTYDGKLRSGIFYRAEARVVYEQEGKQHDAWLPASKIFSSREELKFWLSLKDSDKCSVRWNPKNTSDIEAVLESRSKESGLNVKE